MIFSRHLLPWLHYKLRGPPSTTTQMDSWLITNSYHWNTGITIPNPSLTAFVDKRIISVTEVNSKTCYLRRHRRCRARRWGCPGPSSRNVFTSHIAPCRADRCVSKRVSAEPFAKTISQLTWIPACPFNTDSYTTVISKDNI
jgi:hypothetical protein